MLYYRARSHSPSLSLPLSNSLFTHNMLFFVIRALICTEIVPTCQSAYRPNSSWTCIELGMRNAASRERSRESVGRLVAALRLRIDYLESMWRYRGNGNRVDRRECANYVSIRAHNRRMCYFIIMWIEERCVTTYYGKNIRHSYYFFHFKYKAKPFEQYLNNRICGQF